MLKQLHWFRSFYTLSINSCDYEWFLVSHYSGDDNNNDKYPFHFMYMPDISLFDMRLTQSEQLRALQWRYIIVMVSQVICNQPVCSPAWSDQQQRKYQSLASLAVCGANLPVTEGFCSHRTSNPEVISMSWRHIGGWNSNLLWRQINLFFHQSRVILRRVLNY